MSKYDELKRLAEAVTPETEAMHLFGDGNYVGEHQVLVGAEQKMRGIVGSYFGPGSDDDWEFCEHGSALACIEDYDKWLRSNRLVVNPRQVLELIAENERLQGERDLAVQGGEQIIKGRNKLKAALGECVNSLHCEMLQKFGGQKPEDMHPVTRRDYDRDMAEIAEYRSVLEASA